jgi:hypothetical protein
MEDNARGNPPVILRLASEPRQQIIPLNDPPTDSLLDLRVDSPADGHRKRGVPESSRPEMRPAQQHVRKRRYARRPGHLRPEQVRIHRCSHSIWRSIVPVKIRHSANPVLEFVLCRCPHPFKLKSFPERNRIYEYPPKTSTLSWSCAWAGSSATNRTPSSNNPIVRTITISSSSFY